MLASLKKLADYAPLTGEWSWTGTYDRENRGGDFLIKVEDVKNANDPTETHPLVTLQFGLTDYKLEPLKGGLTTADLTEPPYTGGLLMALYQYKRFLTLGPKGSEGDKCQHAGMEPVYMNPVSGPPKKFDEIRVWCEVVRTEHASVPSKWYFYRADLNRQMPGTGPYPDGAWWRARCTWIARPTRASCTSRTSRTWAAGCSRTGWRSATATSGTPCSTSRPSS